MIQDGPSHANPKGSLAWVELQLPSAWHRPVPPAVLENPGSLGILWSIIGYARIRGMICIYYVHFLPLSLYLSSYTFIHTYIYIFMYSIDDPEYSMIGLSILKSPSLQEHLQKSSFTNMSDTWRVTYMFHRPTSVSHSLRTCTHNYSQVSKTGYAMPHTSPKHRPFEG